MSPSEADLRAALHAGEGDGVDVDRVMAAGHARRAQRRTRLLSTAAVVVVVAAAGTGGALLWGNNSDGPGAGQHAAAAPTPTGGNGPRRGPAATSSPGPDRPACPSSLPRHLLPGGGSPGQFGSDGPLFPRPVTSVVICDYGTQQQSLDQSPPPSPARLVLTGAAARQLVASLEHAPTRRPAIACPMIVRADVRELAVIGVTAEGTPLTAVTTTINAPACQVRVTNGTAVRYDWSPPPGLATPLSRLTPSTAQQVGGRGTPASGHIMNGSPVRS